MWKRSFWFCFCLVAWPSVAVTRLEKLSRQNYQLSLPVLPSWDRWKFRLPVTNGIFSGLQSAQKLPWPASAAVESKYLLSMKSGMDRFHSDKAAMANGNSNPSRLLSKQWSIKAARHPDWLATFSSSSRNFTTQSNWPVLILPAMVMLLTTCRALKKVSAKTGRVLTSTGRESAAMHLLTNRWKASKVKSWFLRSRFPVSRKSSP